MAFGIIHYFPGGTRQQYEASIATAHPGMETLPKGQVFHTAGPSEDGWTVIAIFDTKANWESFRDTTLLPMMKQGKAGSFTTPPQERTFEVAFQMGS